MYLARVGMIPTLFLFIKCSRAIVYFLKFDRYMLKIYNFIIDIMNGGK